MSEYPTNRTLRILSHTRQERPSPLWRPKIYFGTVNFNAQFLERETWRKTAAETEGMLLHVHYFVRKLTTPENKLVPDADTTIRRLAPLLANKRNIIELTYHIVDEKSSPEAIAREHAKNIADLEMVGIPVHGVHVDWILSGWNVQQKEMPRRTGESDDTYFTRILNGVLAKTAKYVEAFRAAGHDEKLYAVFPPIYMDEGPWTNVRKEFRPGITVSRVLNGLFDLGFDGFTADSPHFVLVNPAYRAAGYYDALRSIEWTCRQRGKSFGFIVNGENEKTGAEYDALFAQNTLYSLEMIIAAGLRPDPIIVESWYKGPFQLVPETQPNTFTNTVLRVAEQIRKVPPLRTGR
jgi:hypothetical protein